MLRNGDRKTENKRKTRNYRLRQSERTWERTWEIKREGARERVLNNISALDPIELHRKSSENINSCNKMLQTAWQIWCVLFILQQLLRVLIK